MMTGVAPFYLWTGVAPFHSLSQRLISVKPLLLTGTQPTLRTEFSSTLLGCCSRSLCCSFHGCGSSSSWQPLLTSSGFRHPSYHTRTRARTHTRTAAHTLVIVRSRDTKTKASFCSLLRHQSSIGSFADVLPSRLFRGAQKLLPAQRVFSKPCLT